MIGDAGHEVGTHDYSHESPIAMTRDQEGAILDRSIEHREGRRQPPHQLRRALLGVLPGHG